MKKTVIVLIGIIYAASIFLVTFYGSQTEENTLDIVPVTDIEITGENIGTLEDGTKFITLSKPLTAGSSLTYQIEYKLEPENSTSQKVFFEIDQEFTDTATVTEEGLITIFKHDPESDYSIIIVRIYASDNEGNRVSSVSDKLTILYLNE